MSWTPSSRGLRGLRTKGEMLINLFGGGSKYFSTQSNAFSFNVGRVHKFFLFLILLIIVNQIRSLFIDALFQIETLTAEYKVTNKFPKYHA